MSKVELDNFEEMASSESDVRPRSMKESAVYLAPLQVRAVIGSTEMTVADVLKLSRGAVLDLNKKSGDPIDIMVNDLLVARGDLVFIEEDRVGVTLTEIVTTRVEDIS